jgi:hypothetical protein
MPYGMNRESVMLNIFFASLWLLFSGLSIASAADHCGPELAERVAIPNSRWVVSTQVFRCSATDPGELEVVAEDFGSKRRVSILYLNGSVDTHVEYLGGDRIQISLPNLVAIKSQGRSFGPYQITYRYLPSDDPQARESFQRWVKNPKDPIANKWAEDNIVDKIQPGIPRSAK